MISEDEAKRLHDRATRGIKLSPEEEVALKVWYARQDAAESAALAAAQPSQGMDQLRAQIGEAASRLRVVTQEIEAQTAENERLRLEISVLQRRLSEPGLAPRA